MAENLSADKVYPCVSSETNINTHQVGSSCEHEHSKGRSCVQKNIIRAD